jgi:thiamine pyrophosphate-dependent acetolactate synthase large subunit-like protein
VYVCFDTDLQETRAPGGLVVPEVGKYVPLTKLGPDPAAMEQVADLLVGSQRPVIVADLVGRNPASVPSLLALAEALGAPVVDRGGRFNVPTTHPLDATGAAADALAEADVALLLDVQDPFGALTTPERTTEATGFVQPSDCRVITISVNDLLVRSWTGDYQRLAPAELAISADTAIALPMLVELVRERLVRNATVRDHFSLRGAEWADRNRARRAQWRREAAAAVDRSPLALAAIGAALWELVRDEDWWLVNGNLNGWARRLWSWREPHQYLGGTGGSGLGYGMGAAIGAALAARNTNRLTLNLQADGDLLYTASALWTAAKYDLPMLIVVHNNRSLYNSEEHAMRMAQQRERPLENAGIGTQVRDPNVDFATLARSFGVHGEGPIERPEELRPALERALWVVKDQGKPALVDLVSEAR